MSGSDKGYLKKKSSAPVAFKLFCSIEWSWNYFDGVVTEGISKEMKVKQNPECQAEAMRKAGRAFQAEFTSAKSLQQRNEWDVSWS